MADQVVRLPGQAEAEVHLPAEERRTSPGAAAELVQNWPPPTPDTVAALTVLIDVAAVAPAA